MVIERMVFWMPQEIGLESVPLDLGKSSADDAGSRRNEAYYHTICSLYEKNTICILRFAKEKPLASRIDV